MVQTPPLQQEGWFRARKASAKCWNRKHTEMRYVSIASKSQILNSVSTSASSQVSRIDYIAVTPFSRAPCQYAEGRARQRQSLLYCLRSGRWLDHSQARALKNNSRSTVDHAWLARPSWGRRHDGVKHCKRFRYDMKVRGEWSCRKRKPRVRTAFATRPNLRVPYWDWMPDYSLKPSRKGSHHPLPSIPLLRHCARLCAALQAVVTSRAIEHCHPALLPRKRTTRATLQAASHTRHRHGGDQVATSQMRRSLLAGAVSRRQSRCLQGPYNRQYSSGSGTSMYRRHYGTACNARAGSFWW